MATAALIAIDLMRGVFSEAGFSALFYGASLALAILLTWLAGRAATAPPAPRPPKAPSSVSFERPQLAVLAGLCLFYLLLCFARIKGFPFPAGDEAWLHLALGQWPFTPAGRAPEVFSPYWLGAALLGGAEPSATLVAGRLLSCASGLAVILLVAHEARRRAGAAVALVCAAVFALNPGFAYYGSRLSEDSLMAWLVLAAWQRLHHGGTRPGPWLTAGLLAGLAAATKGSALVLAPALALLAVLRLGRSVWRKPALYCGAAGLALALLPVVLTALLGAGGTKDTELLPLLYYRGLELFGSKADLVLQSDHGLLDILARRMSLLTVGDLVLGVALGLVSGPWVLIALPRAWALRGVERALLCLLAFALPFLGLASWKGGDAGNGLLLIGPCVAAALAPAVLGRYGGGPWRRLRPLLIVGALLPIVVGLISTTLPGSLPAMVTQLRERPGSLGFAGYLPTGQEARLVKWLEQSSTPADLLVVDPLSPMGLRELLPGRVIRDRVLRWRDRSRLESLARALARLRPDPVRGRVLLVHDRLASRWLLLAHGLEQLPAERVERLFPPPGEIPGRFQVFRLVLGSGIE